MSTKYSFLDMDDIELRELWIAELGMNYGRACSALKKAWQGFRFNRNHGDEERVWYYAHVIKRFQAAFGIETTEFSL
jgi:hypothetical protein